MMNASHDFFLVLRKPEDRDDFLRIGVELPKGTILADGELVHVRVSEAHPARKAFLQLVQKHVQQAAFQSARPGTVNAAGQKWLDGYSGETVDQLLSMEGEYRTDSLVLAFEQAINRKAARGLRLSEAELVVLVVEALEREVNNGGYAQFIDNCPDFIAAIVDSLVQIRCNETAAITEDAIRIHQSGSVKDLARCDRSYLDSDDAIADRLLVFIRDHKSEINLQENQSV
jgi:hypothetical protein